MFNFIKGIIESSSLKRYITCTMNLAEISRIREETKIDKDLSNFKMSDLVIVHLDPKVASRKYKLEPDMFLVEDRTLENENKYSQVIGWASIDQKTKVFDLYVDTRYRQRGMGKRLVGLAKDCDALFTNVNNDDHILQKLVCNEGFCGVHIENALENFTTYYRTQ